MTASSGVRSPRLALDLTASWPSPATVARPIVAAIAEPANSEHQMLNRGPHADAGPRFVERSRRFGRLRENREEIAKVVLVGGVIQERSDPKQFFERSQRRPMRVMHRLL